jgi:hypothetical protein
MSDSAIADLEKHIDATIEGKLERVPQLLTAVYALVAGAFALGIWVAGIQMQINNHSVQLEENRKARAEEITSIRALEIKDSADTQMLRNIVEKLDRIERKLSP